MIRKSSPWSAKLTSMRTQQRVKRMLAGSVLALAGLVPAAQAAPPTDSNGATNLQAQTRFLSFIGSFIGETPAVSKAYYNAINPSGSKQNVTAWLKAAGFIGQESDWRASGPQIIACDLGPANGCDIPAHTATGALKYGPNIINTDSHAIVLNAADLGFVRNQFIRCVPNCTAKNAKIYTYLENYPVASFSGVAGGSGFPAGSGYPSDAESSAAVRSAINRPAGACPATGVALSGGACVPGASLQRIADVMFEWAPPEAKPTSSTRFGQLYAYLVDPNNVNSETLTFPADVLDGINNRPDFTLATPSFPPIDTKTGARINFTTADYFAPELDGRGFKQHPTVCLVCHGGKPTNLTASGAYPRGGNIDGFRFLPLDIANLNFSSDLGPDQPATPASIAFTDRAHQEIQIRQYNKAVLLTVDQSLERDDSGTSRPAHLAEVIKGWYAPNFTGTTQNSNFIPNGWTGFDTLYKQTVAPSCRSCHFNRELSLDFGTVANFDQESDILQLALLAECNTDNPSKLDYMPLAHLTYLRYWQTQDGPQTVDGGRLTLDHEPDRLAKHFGFASGVSSYCATNP